MSCNEKRRMMIVWSLLLILLLSSYSVPLFASPATKHLCRPDQRDALWKFKAEFHVDFEGEKTDMWRYNTDCCSWDGISCDPKTGMVLELDLVVSYLNGPLRSNSSLFRLHHLQSLLFSANNLSGILPDSIGDLKHLRVLSLDNCGLFGKIPSSLWNLSYLTDLDLSSNDFTGELPDSFGNLNRLTRLDVSFNKLSGSLPHAPLLNLTSLADVNFGFNRFQGTLPSNMTSLSKLTSFDIRENSFSGSIPTSLFMIPSLITLDLRSNYFSGSLEITNISSLSKLQDLLLGDNNINGPIPRAIWELVNLTSLDLSYLNMSTGIDLSILSHHKSLSQLDLSGITLKISSTLQLPSPIETLQLSSCNILEFPVFLRNQTSLMELDISSNQIEGQVPEWLWSLPEFCYVNMSHNSLTGFEGSADVIQTSLGRLIMLDISSNVFQDPFPLLPNSTRYFLASDNRFSGEIPTAICDVFALGILVLSNNNFTGSLPRCSNYNSILSILHLRNNSLSGDFPEELIGVRLVSLDVSRNKLSGKLPKTLANCTRLEFLNVERNRFNDTFPSWLGSLPYLQILALRSNEFHGPVTYLGPELRIFDISDNRFDGVFPSDYFVGWNAMLTVADIVEHGFDERHYQNSLALVNKGLVMQLVWSSFTFYKAVDVSGNRFQGSIPESIGLLNELIVLNMSNNAFTGHIPQSLENLTSLESLDLSRNRLSGEIPSVLGKLTFLSRMNFSYNMLEGPIPQGTQFQSQDSSSFAMNLALCGIPLQETCGVKKEETTKQEEEDEEEEEVISWIAAAIGYLPGVFCGLTIAQILSSSYKLDRFVIKMFRCFT